MVRLITSELFEKVLVGPVKDGATELHVVTGYASPAMVTKHFEALKNLKLPAIQIDVLIGMTGRDGLQRNSLLGFQSIPRQSLGKGFDCSFTLAPDSIHSKIYVWSTEDGPVQAFAGSANYTQMGFGISANSSRHQEVCFEVDPVDAFDYVISRSVGTIGYKNPEIAQRLTLTETFVNTDEDDANSIGQTPDLGTVSLPLVQSTKEKGKVHNAAGLNWGQREGRNRDQAYIPVPKNVRDENFFPPIGEHFQIVTDDGESFMATIAQEGGKAIEIPHDNSILGKYFRKRLGKESGEFVSTKDLETYGSNSVRISKLQSDLFKLDFRKGIWINFS
jgi:hypothetical protein